MHSGKFKYFLQQVTTTPCSHCMHKFFSWLFISLLEDKEVHSSSLCNLKVFWHYFISLWSWSLKFWNNLWFYCFSCVCKFVEWVCILHLFNFFARFFRFFLHCCWWFVVFLVLCLIVVTPQCLVVSHCNCSLAPYFCSLLLLVGALLLHITTWCLVIHCCYSLTPLLFIFLFHF